MPVQPRGFGKAHDTSWPACRINCLPTAMPLLLAQAKGAQTPANAIHCTICLDLPDGAIYQCTNGHILCEGCHRRVLDTDESRCPTCR
jgi:hypothetical protein